MKGLVYNIQRYSLDDGPGIRTTVFLKGCPLRCQWCSNPESQNRQKELSHRDTLCVKCGKCVALCPTRSLSFSEQGEYQINRDSCTVCETCVENCVYNALTVMGEERSVEDVMEIVCRDKVYYKTSGGGLTVSGGEVLMQPEFAASLLSRAREEGIHTCIETTGFASDDVVRMVFEHCDLIYYDIKHADSDIHKKYTGVSNEIIEKNLKYVLSLDLEVVVRIPFIPGINTSEKDVEDIIRLLNRCGRKMEVHILPYHNYGAGKYKMMGRQYLLEDIKRPDRALMERAAGQFQKEGFDCRIIE